MDEIDFRTCVKCGSDLPGTLDYFHKNSRVADGLDKRCKPCVRSYNNARNKKPEIRAAAKIRGLTAKRKAFGVTNEQYDSMHAEQGGVCAICGKEESIPGRSLAIDHDHDTGKVRQLLCFVCNTGLGKFRDDIQLLRTAVEYLERHK